MMNKLLKLLLFQLLIANAMDQDGTVSSGSTDDVEDQTRGRGRRMVLTIQVVEPFAMFRTPRSGTNLRSTIPSDDNVPEQDEVTFLTIPAEVTVTRRALDNTATRPIQDTATGPIQDTATRPDEITITRTTQDTATRPDEDKSDELTEVKTDVTKATQETSVTIPSEDSSNEPTEVKTDEKTDESTDEKTDVKTEELTDRVDEVKIQVEDVEGASGKDDKSR